jgi:hypothetical protein
LIKEYMACSFQQWRYNMAGETTSNGKPKGPPPEEGEGFAAPPHTQVGTKGPTQNIINYIWAAIVSGILLIFLGSGAGMVVSIFVGKDASAIQPLITLFTATLGFLAGVLTPSPVSNQGAGQ